MIFFIGNNISSPGFFSFFIITFCIRFTRTEKKNARTIHIKRLAILSYTISNFQDSAPSFSSFVQNSSAHLTLFVQFQTTPTPSANDNQTVKRKHNLRITITFYLVFLSGRLLFSVPTHQSCLAFHWFLFI